MRLAVTAERVANGLCNLDGETRRAYRRQSVIVVVPEPPGKSSGGILPLAQVAGADR